MVSSTSAMAQTLSWLSGTSASRTAEALPLSIDSAAKRHAVAQRLGLAGDEQRRRGIQQHDIAERPLLRRRARRGYGRHSRPHRRR